MVTLLNEYLLVFSPENSISEEITKIKHEFKDRYACSYAAQLKPHCTLMKFIQHQRSENHIVKEFNSIISSFSPITITLDGFGQYPFHTVYIKIEDNNRIRAMVVAIKHKFKSLNNDIKPFKPIYLSDPHITIARSMTYTQFDPAWAEWEKRKFAYGFNAYHARLLKKQIGKPKEKYQLVKDFDLTGQKEKDKQLLFF